MQVSADAVTKAGRVTILIADDNAIDRRILQAFVHREGWEAVCAADGLQAVELYAEHRPQIVFMDAVMPGLDGFEAARRIKQLAGKTFVPIIFVTALQEANELAHCLQAGGDDFLSKPYNKMILKAKVDAFLRMVDLHRQLVAQTEKIAQNNAHLVREQAVAKAVFDSIIRARGLSLKNIKHWLSPLAIFNGDVLLAARTPDGSLHVLLGDFTGHGLPAAIGALPTADIFYGMTAKGFAIGDILREINTKLKRVLPVGVFCCASAVAFNFMRQEVRIWHGGVPDGYLWRQCGRVQHVVSKHLPLGVLDSSAFDDTVDVMAMTAGDRLFLCSDGIVEAVNLEGELFGDARLAAIIQNCNDPHTTFSAIKDAVSQFRGEMETRDDFTIVEVTMVAPEELDEPEVSERADDAPGPKDWKMSFEFGPQTLKQFNPLPLLQHVILQVPGLRGHASRLFTVLSELYANALDHGVIGLDSSLKKSPQGFANFFAQRGELLGNLQQGFLRFEFDHQPDEQGGSLMIRVTDSGRGFDHSHVLTTLDDRAALSGRGIALIQHLCESVRFLGDGNRVEVQYRWNYQV